MLLGPAAARAGGAAARNDDDDECDRERKNGDVKQCICLCNAERCKVRPSAPRGRGGRAWARLTRHTHTKGTGKNTPCPKESCKCGARLVDYYDDDDDGGGGGGGGGLFGSVT